MKPVDTQYATYNSFIITVLMKLADLLRNGRRR
jgi:hypothetical protein